MKIRSLKAGDIDILRSIHKKHYPDDGFADFGKLHSVLVVTTDDGEIISAGGIELMAEGIIVTDKDAPPLLRGKALQDILHSMMFTCSRLDKDILHAYVVGHEDITWLRALESYGFNRLKGRMLFKKV